MSSVSEIISEINSAFSRLFQEMDSGNSTVKCPFCKYDVYIHRSKFHEHIVGSHDIQKDAVLHKKGDFLEELR